MKEPVRTDCSKWFLERRAQKENLRPTSKRIVHEMSKCFFTAETIFPNHQLRKEGNHTVDNLSGNISERLRQVAKGQLADFRGFLKEGCFSPEQQVEPKGLRG